MADLQRGTRDDAEEVAMAHSAVTHLAFETEVRVSKQPGSHQRKRTGVARMVKSDL